MEAKDIKGALPVMGAMRDLVTGKYKKQVTWRDPVTGCLLAESDFFEPLTINPLVVPGYGGRCYFPTDIRYPTLQVIPAEKTA